jgi:hypothetical protein
MRRTLLMAGIGLMLSSTLWGDEAKVTQTQRGATVETDRYRVVVENGVVQSILNKLTREEYLDLDANPANVLPHLPSGLGTQAGSESQAAAETLYHWPWWEHPAQSTWINQHYPGPDSKFQFAAKGTSGGTLTYEGLTDGKTAYPDETFGLDIEVETATGDLLITPWAKSPRQGVYAANLTVAPLAPVITAEAPIFDGVRLDRNMQHMLWANAWGGYWDYAFLALNGYLKGAVAIWTQDAELKYYKTLFYLINPQGLSFSFSTMNLPPFEELKEARTAQPWRLQAFDKSWAQGVARFRDWRLKNVKIAPRPEWTKHISFVNNTVNANKGWLDRLSQYFGGTNLDRTVSWGATVRKAKFDTCHYDNTPYDGFKEDTKLWKAAGAWFMPYLQPMIMWGAPPEDKVEWRKIWDMHVEADTRSVFQTNANTVVPFVDQHNLGHQGYQRWFLDCVKNYIQDCGADGIYHDQSYHCPIDRRGNDPKLGNMTSVQGMADYFNKAQTENPNSIHGTEHMTEVNNIGASLGIAGGILWGTAPSMRWQRLEHASCISAALSWPNGVLFSFPHYSGLSSGNAKVARYHWGLDLMERRAEIAGTALQGDNYTEATVGSWRNERWVEVARNRTFVHYGLRPVFPEDFDRSVLSYFQGAKGEDFRYVQFPWGTALMEYGKDGKTTMHYGRIHGVSEANTDGGVCGWPMYNDAGPAGLHPERYYVVDPDLKRPEVYFSTANRFSPGLYETFVEDGFANSQVAWLRLREGPRGIIISYDAVILHAPTPPIRVLVNGKETKFKEVGTNAWRIGDFQCPADVVAFLKEPPNGLDAGITNHAFARALAMDWRSDLFDAAGLTAQLTAKADKEGKSVRLTGSKNANQILLTVRPPASAAGAGSVRFAMNQVQALSVNGVDRLIGVDDKKNSSSDVRLAGKDDYAFVVLSGDGSPWTQYQCGLEWIPDPAAPATNAAPTKDTQ